VVESYDRYIDVGYFGNTAGIWAPSYAPGGKTEQFKSLVRKVGFVDYWKARGWPDLCGPQGTDDFVCE